MSGFTPPAQPSAWPPGAPALQAPMAPPNISDDGFAAALAHLSSCEKEVRAAIEARREAERAESSRVDDLIIAQREFDRIVSARRAASPAGDWTSML